MVLVRERNAHVGLDCRDSREDDINLMGTLHQIRPIILDEDGRDNEDEDGRVDEPEHGDGDGGDEDVVMCSICKWWQPDFESEGIDGVPIRGTCRYNPPPWAETPWNDWCRLFEKDS